MIPPGTGIIHLMNLETIAEVVTVDNTAPVPLLHADCMIATDSHTPMINATGFWGGAWAGSKGRPRWWGTRHPELPEVIGISVSGALSPDVSDSDWPCISPACCAKPALSVSLLNLPGLR